MGTTISQTYYSQIYCNVTRIRSKFFFFLQFFWGYLLLLLYYNNNKYYYLLLCGFLVCRSSAHGISFEIPFYDPMACASGQGLSRSASSEGLGFKVPNSARGMRRHLSFQPVNGSTHTPLQEEKDDDLTSHNCSVRLPVITDSRYFFSDTN